MHERVPGPQLPDQPSPHLSAGAGQIDLPAGYLPVAIPGSGQPSRQVSVVIIVIMESPSLVVWSIWSVGNYF